MKIQAYAAHAPKTPLQPFSYEAEDLGAFGAEVEISHCGVCHSDLHLADGDWGTQHFPMVPGHEIIGTVKRLGSAADATLLGQRVGIGWQRSSCLHCEWCMTGQENLCRESVDTCVGHYGGFAQQIITDSRFMHPIPEALSSENAAPLLCAGITVYSPLARYADHTSRVGIIGIGGLGHLALQFADKMGCEVTAFSSSESKQDEALELGADHFVNGRDESAMKSARGSLDLLICTAPYNLDWAAYLRTLRPNATLCFVANSGEPISFNVGRIFSNQSVAGSSIGGRQMMRDMLDFAARQKINTWTETLPMDSVNTAFERLRSNDVRYRFVLEA
ncbi:MAG: NAD(P)-dependent alcohol dehydrogenase [Anaerolineae bacterium]|nr:NAD(P)-dependent alcohol dehydrogenase [Anaerolineae bacterium]